MKKKRDGKNKGSGGRKARSGVLSGIQPERETWDDICNRIVYGSAEWRILRLRELKLPNSDVSTSRDEVEARWLWHEWRAQCERAVLDGDADWFERQAKAIRIGGLRQRAQFNAKVVHLLKMATMFETRLQGDNRESFVVDTTEETPAGKFTDAMASDIYNVLETQSKSPLVVEHCQFESKARAMEAIHDIAKQLRFELRKQH